MYPLGTRKFLLRYQHALSVLTTQLGHGLNYQQARPLNTCVRQQTTAFGPYIP
jgi:hypothetical protein